MENSYLTLIVAVVGYLIFQWVFKKLFYNGKVDGDNWMVFNLSSFAEYFLIIALISFAYVSLLEVLNSNSVWYVRILEWIWDLFWILFFLISGLGVYVNRKNHISIKGNQLKYKVGKEEGILSFINYKFNNDILELEHFENEEKAIKSIDLRTNGLKGFKTKMEIYLKKELEANLKQN